MRYKDTQGDAFWSYVSAEERMPADHPLRPIREMVNVLLRKLWPKFNKTYLLDCRPSIPPEPLLRALLAQVLHTVRSGRILMDQLHYTFLSAGSSG
jgi:transposase